MPHRDTAWSSTGLEKNDAIHHWRRYFAERQETQVAINVHDPADFAGQMASRGIGQLRLLHLKAPAQTVSHIGTEADEAEADHLVHLIFAISGLIHARAKGVEFVVKPGESVLIDNSAGFVLDMPTRHEAIDLIMPLPWLQLHLRDPLAHLGRPLQMATGWAPPLAAMLVTVAEAGDDYPLPRTMVADLLGNLIALATREGEITETRPGARLAQQILLRIENDYADPELSPEGVAADLGISKRYLQALLANSGTSFVRELNAVRLDRASALLTDRRNTDLPVSEIAFRCGFLDPGYFTRQFRKRFNATPRAWRGMN